MTQLELPLDDKLQRARQIYLENKHYTGMSFHIRKMCGTKTCKVKFVSRYYPSYDRPDWTSFFEVTQPEADAIVQAGYASYWNSRDETWKTN